MTIVPFDRLKAVPWKNGLGITREIAVEPQGATMDDFVWRVSIADVDTASPFSRFPGIDRTIVLLEGDGFTMQLDGKPKHALTIPCVPFAFVGEATVEVTLAGGATRDFNLMVRRDVARGVVEVVTGPATLTVGGDIVLIYIAQGEGRGEGVPVRQGDSLLGSGNVELATGATALLARVTPRAD